MKPKKGYAFLIILAAIFWSLNALIRRQLGHIPAPMIVMIEHGISALLVLPFIPKFLPQFKKLNFKDWLTIVLISLIGGGLAFIMYTQALSQVNNISYSVVVLLQQTQPIFAILLATVLLKEKITLKYSLFSLVALISSYFLMFPSFKPTFFNSRSELIAAGLALGAAVCWGSATTLGKFVLRKISYVALAMARFILVVPLAWLIGTVTQKTYPLTSITFMEWKYLGALAFFSGIISFLIYYKGLQHTQAKVASIAELTWPVGATFIGISYLHEKLTAIQIIASIILMIDIILLSLYAYKE